MQITLSSTFEYEKKYFSSTKFSENFRASQDSSKVSRFQFLAQSDFSETNGVHTDEQRRYRFITPPLRTVFQYPCSNTFRYPLHRTRSTLVTDNWVDSTKQNQFRPKPASRGPSRDTHPRIGRSPQDQGAPPAAIMCVGVGEIKEGARTDGQSQPPIWAPSFISQPQHT